MVWATEPASSGHHDPQRESEEASPAGSTSSLPHVGRDTIEQVHRCQNTQEHSRSWMRAKTIQLQASCSFLGRIHTEIRSQSHTLETSVTRLTLVLRPTIRCFSFPFNIEQQNLTSFSLRWGRGEDCPWNHYCYHVRHTGVRLDQKPLISTQTETPKTIMVIDLYRIYHRRHTELQSRTPTNTH